MSGDNGDFYNRAEQELPVPLYFQSGDEKTRKEAARTLRDYIVTAGKRAYSPDYVVSQLTLQGWPRKVVIDYLKYFYKQSLVSEQRVEKQQSEPDSRMRALVVFGVLFALFIGYMLFYEPTITGLTVLDNQMIFAENTTLDLGMNVTSMGISGTFQGAGSARVYLGDALVASFPITNESKNEKISPINGTNETISINETTNRTINETNTTGVIAFGVIEENLTNITDRPNITNATEITTAPQEIVLANTTPPNITESNVTNVTENNATFIVFGFTGLCVETCEITNFSSSVLRVEIDGSVLTIASFNYTVVPQETLPLPETNATLNVTDGYRGQPSVVLKNRHNIQKGRVVVINNTDGTFDVELDEQEIRGIGIAALSSEVRLHGVRNTPNFTAKIDDYIGEEPRSGEITTDVVAVSNVTMEQATIRLVKKGDVNAIVKCKEFDIEFFSCAAWEKTDIPFVDLGDIIEFTVNSFSGYGGAQLGVINVQSYPTLGGNWTVRFNTTGATNLTITAVNGTTWSNSADVGDLRFIEVRCGDVVQAYQWINDSVFIANYSCAVNSSETSKTLTEGKHNLMFVFGDDVDFAFNDVNTKPSLSNVILNTTDWTTNSSDTNLTLNFTATDAEGNRLKNITVWYVNATSLVSLYMPFENGTSNASNATFARDYSFFGNNGTVVGANITPQGGYDGYSAYSFDGSNDYITSSLPEIGSNGFTIEFRALPRANLSYANLSGDMCIVDISVVRVCFTRDGYIEASVTGDDTDSTWNNSGALGTNTDLYAFAVWNGSLYAAMGGSNGANISRYDGITNWTSVGQLNTGGNANALAVFNNTLYAGESGTGSTGRVFRYDGGTTWTSTGTVITDATTVEAMVTWNGSLYAASSGAANGVARYDAGPTWTDISGFSGQSPRTMIVWNGSLFAGMSNGKTYRYNSSNTWISLGSPGSTGQLDSFVVWNGSLYANGYDGATTNQSVFQYNGTDGSNNNWTWLGQFQSGGGSSNIYSFAVYNKTLFAGGSSSGVLFSWNGTNWPFVQIGGGAGGNVRGLAVWNGSLWAGTSIAGGTITIFRYGNGTALRSTGKLWDGGWQHIVMTRNTTDMGLYINGVLNSSIFIAPYLPKFSAFATQPLHIGRSWGSSAGEWTSGNDYNGTIDELRIYNRSLTPRQIGALFNNLTHVIDSNETAIGEVWQACVTVNDGTDDGNTTCSNNVTILGGDATPPAVTSLLPAQNSEYNVSMNIEIAATVTDERSTVSTVLANITLPNASAQLVTLSNGTAHPTKYNASYTIPRATGLYNVTIVANDTNLNYNNTQRTNFTAGQQKPIMNNASLNTTDITTNNTDVNLTLYINASDPDRGGMKNITDWRVGGSSIAVLNMPFESGGNASNSTFTRDYSSYANNGTVSGATHSSAGGYEGFGAYVFDGLNDYITANLPTIGQSGFTIEFRANPRSNFSQANLSGDMCAIDAGVVRVCFNRDGYAEASVVGKGTAYVGFEGSATIYTLTVWNGTLYFTHSQNGTIYRYDGLTNWTQVGMLSQALTGTTGLALNVWNGSLYAGEVNTTGARVFRYDGDTTWTPVGNPVSASNAAVVVLTAWNGSLYAGVNNGSVARYDGGTTWTWIGLGATADGGIGSLNVWNNTLYAGTSTAGRIYRYLSDTTWVDMGHPGVASTIATLVVFNGTLYTGTGNTTPPVNASVFRYDAGTDANWTWITQINAGSSQRIRSMAVWNGSLYAGTDSGGKLYVYDNANNFDSVFTMLASDVRAMAVFNSSLFIGTGTSGYVYRHGNGTSLRSTGKLWENVYHHIVVVRDTTRIALYIDGVLNASIGLSDYLPAMKNPVQIGRGWGSSSSGGISGLDYNGNIDDVRIYNRGLSANQIFSLYTNRTDIIASDETDGNEVWQACVTPNDGIENGNTVCSNSLTITGVATSSSTVTSTEAAAAEVTAPVTVAPEYTYTYTPYTSPYAGYSFAEIMAIMQSMYIPPPYTPPPDYTSPYAVTQAAQEAYQPVAVRDISFAMTNEWTRPVSNLEIYATSTPPSFMSMYTAKAVAPRIGAFGISTEAVDTRALMASFAQAVQIDQLRPGETFEGTMQINVPFATTDSVPIQLVYTTQGQEIATREVMVRVAPKVFASAVDVKKDLGAMDMYAVVSNPKYADTIQQFAAQAAALAAAEQALRVAAPTQDIEQAVRGVVQIVTTEKATPAALARIDMTLGPVFKNVVERALSREYIAAEQKQDVLLDKVVSQLVENIAQEIITQEADPAMAQEKLQQIRSQVEVIMRETAEKAAKEVVAQKVRSDVEAELPYADMEQVISEMVRKKAQEIFDGTVEVTSPAEGLERVAREVADDIKTKIAVKDAAKKAIREAAQKADDFTISERVAERAVQEASEQAMREAAEAIFKAAMKAAMKDLGEDVPADAVAGAIAIAVEKTLKDLTQEAVVKEALQEASQEEIKDAAKAPLQDALKDRIKRLPIWRGEGKELIKGLPVFRGDEVKQLIEEAVEEQSDAMIEEAAETAVEEGVPESATKEDIQDAAREAAGDAIDDVVAEAVDEALDELVPGDEVKKAVSGELSDTLISEIVAQAVEKKGAEEEAPSAGEEREIVKGLPVWRGEGKELTEETKEEIVEAAEDALPKDGIQEAAENIVDDARSEEVKEAAAETVTGAIKETVKEGIDPNVIKNSLDELVKAIGDEDLQKAADAAVEAALKEGLSKEDAQDAAEDAVKEAVGNVIKRSVENAIKEASKDAVQDVVNAALPKAEIKEAAKNAVDEVVSSREIRDAVADAVKEETKKIVKGSVKDSVKDIVKDAVKDAIVEGVSEETVKEAVKEAATGAIREAVQDAVKDVGDQAVAADAEEKVKEAVNEAIKEAAKEAVEEVSTEEVVKEAIDAVVEEITKDIVKESVVIAAIKKEVRTYLDREAVGEATTTAAEVSEAGVSDVSKKIVKEAVSVDVIKESAKALAEAVLTKEAIREAAAEASKEAVESSVPPPLIKDIVEEAIKGAADEAVKDAVREIAVKVVKDTIRDIARINYVPAIVSARIENAVREKMAEESARNAIKESVNAAITEYNGEILRAVEEAGRKEPKAAEQPLGELIIPGEETKKSVKTAAQRTFSKELLIKAAAPIVKRRIGIAFGQSIKRAAKSAIPKDIVRSAAERALKEALKTFRNTTFRSMPQLEAPAPIQENEELLFITALTGAAIAQEIMELDEPDRTVREAIRRVVDDGVPEEAIILTIKAATQEAVSGRTLKAAIDNIAKENVQKELVNEIVIDALSAAAEEVVKEVVVDVINDEVWENVQLVIDTAVPEEVIRVATEEVIEQAIAEALSESSLSRLVDDTLREFTPEDLTLEITLKKDASRAYDPSLGMAGFFESVFNGPKAVSSELLGPYPLKPDERLLLGQQFKYPPDLIGEYDVELVYRRGAEVLGRQSHAIDLKKECTQDADCPSDYICKEQFCSLPEGGMNIAQLIGRGLALGTLLSVMILGGYSFFGSFSGHKRQKQLQDRMLDELQHAYDELIADYMKEEMGNRPKAEAESLLVKHGWSVALAHAYIKRFFGKEETKSLGDTAADIKNYGQTLVDFISRNTSRGLTKEAIINALVRKGWNENIVNNYVRYIEEKRAGAAVMKKEEMRRYGRTLAGFIIENIRKGLGKEEIVKALVVKGWEKKVAERAVDDMYAPKDEKEKDVIRSDVKKYSTIIAEFIRTEMKKGFTREQIAAALVRKGWDKKVIRLYMGYFMKTEGNKR